MVNQGHSFEQPWSDWVINAAYQVTKIVEGFTMWGCGGYFCHVTETLRTKFYSSTLWRLFINLVLIGPAVSEMFENVDGTDDGPLPIL